MTIDLSKFNHMYSTDPPKPRVVITHGKFKGSNGRLMGRWTYPYHYWTIKLDERTHSKDYVSVPPEHYKEIE